MTQNIHHERQDAARPVRAAYLVTRGIAAHRQRCMLELACFATFAGMTSAVALHANSGGGIAMTEQCDLDDVADAMDAVGSAVVEAVDAAVMRRSSSVPSHEYVAALHAEAARRATTGRPTRSSSSPAPEWPTNGSVGPTAHRSVP